MVNDVRWLDLRWTANNESWSRKRKQQKPKWINAAHLPISFRKSNRIINVNFFFLFVCPTLHPVPRLTSCFPKLLSKRVCLLLFWLLLCCSCFFCKLSFENSRHVQRISSRAIAETRHIRPHKNSEIQSVWDYANVLIIVVPFMRLILIPCDVTELSLIYIFGKSAVCSLAERCKVSFRSLFFHT